MTAEREMLRGFFGGVVAIFAAFLILYLVHFG